MATRKAVDHQTRVVTSVMKVFHFPPENPRGRGGKKKQKEKNTNQKKRVLSKFMKEESEVLLTFTSDGEQARRQDEFLRKQTLLWALFHPSCPNQVM